LCCKKDTKEEKEAVSDQKKVAIAAVEAWLQACSKGHETSRQRTETAQQSLAESEQGFNEVINMASISYRAPTRTERARIRKYRLGDAYSQKCLCIVMLWKRAFTLYLLERLPAWLFTEPH
jgi:hypothetical protein